MNCTNPITLTKNIDRLVYPDGLTVPCGKCLNCRIQYRTMWATRLYHEADYWDQKSFVTLTYKPGTEPVNRSVRKDHAQKWIKRLRKNANIPIKYYLCGEYGDLTNRPHYHAILLGIGLIPEHRQLVMDSWPYTDWTCIGYRRESFGLVEPESIQYVTQYIDKKYSGEVAKDVYLKTGREIPFRLCSHGLGKRFAEDNSEQIRKSGFISIRGKKRSIPRYYLDKAQFTSEELERVRNRAQEKEIEFVEKITGLSYSRTDAYRILDVPSVLAIEETYKSQKAQLEKNRKAKIALKQRTL